MQPTRRLRSGLRCGRGCGSNDGVWYYHAMDTTMVIETRKGWLFRPLSWLTLGLRHIGVERFEDSLVVLAASQIRVRQPGGTWRRITDKRALRA